MTRIAFTEVFVASPKHARKVQAALTKAGFTNMHHRRVSYVISVEHSADEKTIALVNRIIGEAGR